MANHTEHDPTLTDDEDEVVEELQDWDDWNADEEEEEEEEESSDLDSEFLCLFCDSRFTCCDELFDHCTSTHHFDFRAIRNALGLSFYSSFKLINYVRSQVFDNKCWSCGLSCRFNKDLQDHLHETVVLKDIKPVWDSDEYLKPFLPDDAVLYSFGEDEEGDDEYNVEVDKDELMSDLRHFEKICIDNQIHVEKIASDSCGKECEIGERDAGSSLNGCLNTASSSGKVTANGVNSGEHVGSGDRLTKGKGIRAYVPNHGSKDMKNVNDDYFASYSSFGIHREMLNDKVRMDAYGQAILKNPSLLKSAVVMDLGCGTGILSLFAAQAGASRVIAVEASEKMASVATRIAEDNGLLRKSPVGSTTHGTGVIEVVQGMVEELDKSMDIKPHSVDVLLSEWMGYCLLYEAMLSSVLFARDKWLKPGGAILPDTATIFVAGFGKGATSLQFWENVYGFNMSCVGKELFDGAAKVPIVDVVEDYGLVTNAAILQTFDLVTMKPDEVDFTGSVVLEPNNCGATSGSNDLKSETTWCYGIVLWFETGFTSRFCKEKSAVLSTSPYTPPTHWMQTILTFQEPIAVTSRKACIDRSAAVGTEVCPAVKIQLRISIARASQHRSIDISLETTGIDPHGRKHSWPVQLFNLS